MPPSSPAPSTLHLRHAAQPSGPAPAMELSTSPSGLSLRTATRALARGGGSAWRASCSRDGRAALRSTRLGLCARRTPILGRLHHPRTLAAPHLSPVAAARTPASRCRGSTGVGEPCPRGSVGRRGSTSWLAGCGSPSACLTGGTRGLIMYIYGPLAPVYAHPVLHFSQNVSPCAKRADPREEAALARNKRQL
jgi:hypothetical protein